jgi:hypothetical protein
MGQRGARSPEEIRALAGPFDERNYPELFRERRELFAHMAQQLGSDETVSKLFEAQEEGPLKGYLAITEKRLLFVRRREEILFGTQWGWKKKSMPLGM